MKDTRVRGAKLSDRAAVEMLLDRDPHSSSRCDERDTVFVAELGGRLGGVLAARLVILVHRLCLLPGTASRRVAAALVHYAVGAARAMGQQEAFFIVEPDNVAMQRFVEGLGAQREPDAIVYRLNLE